MTAASYTSRSLVPPARSVLRFRRLLAALGVCLPVPICAASGLSLPLPATVERIAAALVPWTNAVTMSANEALRPGAAGSIVREADESRGERNGAFAAEITVPGRPGKTRVRILVPRPIASRPMRSTEGDVALVALVPAAGIGSTPAAREAPGGPATAHVEGGGQPQPPAASAPAPSASIPTDNAAPAPPVANTPSEPEPSPPPTGNEPDPVAPVKEAVSEVTAPVAPVVETTTSAVKETVAPVTELLPGLGK
jgi:hypothetical protein